MAALSSLVNFRSDLMAECDVETYTCFPQTWVDVSTVVRTVIEDS